MGTLSLALCLWCLLWVRPSIEVLFITLDSDIDTSIRRNIGSYVPVDIDTRVLSKQQGSVDMAVAYCLVY